MTRIRHRSMFAAPLLLSAGVFAGDCEPEWDLSIGQPGANSGVVFDFAELDGDLYASGSFTQMGGVSAARIARWDGAAWSPLGSGLSSNECYAVASYDGEIYAGGYFNLAGGVPGTAKLAKWNGSSWESLGAQLELFSNQLWDLTTWDDGDGEALYIAGNYQNVGGVANASYIAKWDGATFSALGAPIGGAVPLIIFTSYVWDDGGGEALYVGGRFLSIDGVPANRVAKWDGESWSALGSGITGPGLSTSVMSMAAFDDGSGEQLYVAGQTFDTAGGAPADRVARWNGASWSPVGDGFANGIVWGLEVFDDGNGEALYAFGTFTMSGSDTVSKVAKWNGASWEGIPEGAPSADCYAGFVHDDCVTGPALYIGGAYTSIAGGSANRVSRLAACPDDATPGDFNGDGAVNARDLATLLAAWGDCGCCPEDLDGDGMVGASDLAILLANWG